MSLIGKRSANHQTTLIGTPVDVTDSIDDRRTPPQIFTPLDERYQFTVDAAASNENALLDTYWDRTTDGLTQDWSGHRVWCNPPYSDIRPWVEKAAAATRCGCELVVMLLPANRTEQAWWQDYIEMQRDIGGRVTTRFLRGRHRFGRPPGAPTPVGGDRPPFGLVLVTWKSA